MNNYLKQLGLTQNSIKAYKSLLEMKSGSATEIAVQSGITRTLVYDSLRLLENKGLVQKASKGKKKKWICKSPLFLKNLVKETEERLDSILPDLINKFENTKTKDPVYFTKNTNEIKIIIDHFFSNVQSDLRIFGCWKMLEDFLTNENQEPFSNKFTLMKNIKVIDVITNSHFYCEEGHSLVSENIKFLPSSYKFETMFVLYDSVVLLFTPEQEGYFINIQSALLSSTLRSWHDSMWDLAEDIDQQINYI